MTTREEQKRKAKARGKDTFLSESDAAYLKVPKGSETNIDRRVIDPQKRFNQFKKSKRTHEKGSNPNQQTLEEFISKLNSEKDVFKERFAGTKEGDFIPGTESVKLKARTEKSPEAIDRDAKIQKEKEDRDIISKVVDGQERFRSYVDENGVIHAGNTEEFIDNVRSGKYTPRGGTSTANSNSGTTSVSNVLNNTPIADNKTRREASTPFTFERFDKDGKGLGKQQGFVSQDGKVETNETFNSLKARNADPLSRVYLDASRRRDNAIRNPERTFSSASNERTMRGENLISPFQDGNTLGFALPGHGRGNQASHGGFRTGRGTGFSGRTIRPFANIFQNQPENQSKGGYVEGLLALAQDQGKQNAAETDAKLKAKADISREKEAFKGYKALAGDSTDAVSFQSHTATAAKGLENLKKQLESGTITEEEFKKEEDSLKQIFEVATGTKGKFNTAITFYNKNG